MNKAEVSYIPVHLAHAEFYEWYDFGDHLQVGDSLEDMHKKTLKKLRHQYLHDQNVEQKLCLRNCFKLTRRKYAEYCLEKKCGGIDFIEAAKMLGYYKA
mmetsp:Transcript_70296/g.81937  ORF Transcript_70296/g.81937 Transcript_70296/m.81937 type:complete len:99 (+) Transcript_70296:34-330(+)|eukprot:CAMPEP_0176441306 /NCGR_PEP_ID=MMETSP0127-20121128/21114_1 /TAXON_ID=938130 /ORGANISM="Platyophrya macrostoma, Strain WH" /LENGTH=98 /DNA_ID=CAMNT_0017826049 /DNA_START=14 /DNA_END=310 /DNA_ORIENTATION=+